MAEIRITDEKLGKFIILMRKMTENLKDITIELEKLKEK